MQLDSRDQKILFDYWTEKKGSRAAPRRSDIDPLDFPKLLPYIFLYDVHSDPYSLTMRLFGTMLVEARGRDCTGETFEQVHEGVEVTDVRKDYDKTALTLTPTIKVGAATWINKDYLKYSRLLLPLSEDGKKANMLLGFVTFIK